MYIYIYNNYIYTCILHVYTSIINVYSCTCTSKLPKIKIWNTTKQEAKDLRTSSSVLSKYFHTKTTYVHV